MTALEMVAVAWAGLTAGFINAVVGSGTLGTFPVLLAVGLPPVTATISALTGAFLFLHLPASAFEAMVPVLVALAVVLVAVQPLLQRRPAARRARDGIDPPDVLVATDRIDWRAAGLVAAGSLVGGYVGSTVGRRLPAPVLRAGIVVLGVVAIVVLLSR